MDYFHILCYLPDIAGQILPVCLHDIVYITFHILYCSKMRLFTAYFAWGRAIILLIYDWFFRPYFVIGFLINDSTSVICICYYDPRFISLRISLLVRRHRSGRNNQVLSGHAGQARELLHVLLPPHQRVCVKGHLLHCRAGHRDISKPSDLTRVRKKRKIFKRFLFSVLLSVREANCRWSG